MVLKSLPIVGSAICQSADPAIVIRSINADRRFQKIIRANRANERPSDTFIKRLQDKFD